MKNELFNQLKEEYRKEYKKLFIAKSNEQTEFIRRNFRGRLERRNIDKEEGYLGGLRFAIDHLMKENNMSERSWSVFAEIEKEVRQNFYMGK